MTQSRHRHGPGPVVLALLLCAPFLAQADATIANVATPSIQSDLGASATVAELVVGGYLTAYAVLLITGARLGHIRGYHRLYLVGAGAFGATSLIAGLAPNSWVLIAARVVQGGSAALMYPQALTGIQQLFSGESRARAIGSFAMALAGGAVFGQVLGGVLIWANLAGTSWRPIFLVNVPLCLAQVLIGWRRLPRGERAGSTRRLDLPGVALLTVTLLLAVLPLALGSGRGWPVWALICLAASVPAFVVFLWAQRRTAARVDGQPLLNVHILARRPVLLALLALLAATATYFAFLFTLALYLQHGLGRSALFSGLALVPWVAAFGVAGRVAGRLRHTWRVAFAPCGYGLLTLVYAVHATVLLAGLELPDPVLLVLLACGGAGLGLSFNSLLSHLTGAVPGEYAADISGVTTTSLQVGGALGVAAFGSLYAGVAGGAGGAAHASHAFAVTNVGMAVASAVAAFLAFAAVRRSPSSAREPSDTALTIDQGHRQAAATR